MRPWLITLLICYDTGMRNFSSFLILAWCWTLPGIARAGLYYSGEVYADLPAQWRGYLVDQRALRNISQRPLKDGEPNPLRTRYVEEAARLEKAALGKQLTADELADLGAIHVRLGDPGKAIAWMRPAQRRFPNHFPLAANLGAAWQLHGDLAQAALCLEQAVRLAPGKHLAAETMHLKLVRGRLKPGRNAQSLDDLFEVRFVNDQKVFEPGQFAAVEKKKLPARAVALAQQLGLWLPADGLLLWQLAELANAHGDLRAAAAMYDGCVVHYGMASPELRQHRQLTRAAVDALAKIAPPDKAGHEEGHAAALAFRSRRPLVATFEQIPLPPISDTGVNQVPWDIFRATTLDAKFRPTFAKYLTDLKGKEIALHGFMQPLRAEEEMDSFLLIEFPVGCWYCEMPDTTGMLRVELLRGKSTRFTRGLVRITGRLSLNSTDPEDFLYTISDASVGTVN